MKNILIVDDDITFLKIISKKFEALAKNLTPIFVKDGFAAVSQIKNKDISLVVSDLQMPKMDGYGLLEFITSNYPDIPVIIVTAFGKPKSKKILLEKGAVSYFEKPLDHKDLIFEIKRLLEKQLDGGVLKSASLEMFVQLLEMEQKTCTIRVEKSEDGKKGVLFFKNGELYQARTGCINGLDAALKIFNWQDVSLLIENECTIKNRKINMELQAVLLEAMRLKDEIETECRNSFVINEKEEEPETNNKLSPVEQLRDFISSNPEDITGINEVYKDDSWKKFLCRVCELGSCLKGGGLKACYINRDDSKSFILVPDKEDMVLSVGKKCNREKIYKILMD